VGPSFPDYLSHEHVKIQFSGEVGWCLLSFLKATDKCFGLHSPGIFFSGIQINFSFSFPCCCNIPDTKFACLTVHKSISGSLPGRKHLFYINNLFAKVQVFLEVTHWLISVLELRIYDGWITFLLAHRFFNARNSNGEIVKVQLLNLMKLNLNKTWKVMRGKTKKPLHYWNKGWT